MPAFGVEGGEGHPAYAPVLSSLLLPPPPAEMRQTERGNLLLRKMTFLLLLPFRD